MRRILTLTAFVAILSGLAMAETLTGKLLDATCIDQQKSATCDPTSTTTAFAILASGKTVKFDDAGNAKAVEALKNRADRSKDPASPSNQIMARVSGMVEGDVVKVSTIQVQ